MFRSILAPNPPWTDAAWGPTARAIEPPGDDDPTREGPSLFWGAGHRLVAREPAGVGLSYGDSRTISAPIRFFKK